MAGRVGEFCESNPDPNPVTAQVPVRLTGLREEATQLLNRQQQAQATVAAAVKVKEMLRDGIGVGSSSLMGIARAAARTHPTITVHRRLPKSGTHSNELVMLTTVRVAVAEAESILPLLEPFGATKEQLTALNQLLDEYEAELTRQRRAINSQIGATAELKGVTADILAVVRNLDALHRLRFHEDRDRLATWKRARKVTRPQPPEELEPPVDGTQAA